MPLLPIAVPPPQSPASLGSPTWTATGKGVQIYTCGTGGTWVFTAPEATLYSNGKIVGTHSAGPRWTWSDGSALTGNVVSSIPSPEPRKNIPSLVLRTTSVPGTNGVLSPIVQVRRTDTQGGVAPSSGCDAAHLGATERVPYTATYSFYR